MFKKMRQVLKDLDTLFLLLQAHADDLQQLKADIAAIKPKKKVVTKTVIKTEPKPVAKKK
jgi:uncharacterized membrane protein